MVLTRYLRKGDIQMYYKSLIETLKDKDKENRITYKDKENRITIDEQTTDNNLCYIDATLAPIIKALIEKCPLGA